MRAWGRKFVSYCHCPVVMSQPIVFFSLKKQANLSTWFIFRHLICHFLARHFLVKCSLRSSVRSLWSCRIGRLMKAGPSVSSRKVQNLIQQTFREEQHTNIHVLWNVHSGYTIIRWCLILYRSCWYVWRGGWAFCSAICDQNMSISLKIQLWCLESLFFLHLGLVKDWQLWG